MRRPEESEWVMAGVSLLVAVVLLPVVLFVCLAALYVLEWGVAQ